MSPLITSLPSPLSGGASYRRQTARRLVLLFALGVLLCLSDPAPPLPPKIGLRGKGREDAAQFYRHTIGIH